MAEWFSSLRLRLRALLRRRQLEQDLRDELAFHLAMREAQYRAAGAADARAAARRRFGSVTGIHEDLRDAWAFAPALRALLSDFRYGARTLRRSPTFTAVVVLTLGLGIGANTAFFSIVNAVLIRPLGYADAERLVLVHEAFPAARIARLPFSALDFDDLRAAQRSFESVAAFRSMPFELSEGGSPERIQGAKVSADLFRTLGVAPFAGRTFSADEDRPQVNLAVLSWALWQRRYAADPTLVGRTIQLDRQPFTVIGIMPAGFTFPRRGMEFNGAPADVWVPIAFTERDRMERAMMHNNSVVARLRAGLALETAQQDLQLVSATIAASYPAAARNSGFSPQLVAQPIRAEISGRIERPLLMLLAAVAFVLLVACANVANLVVSRVAARSREFAVRAALGARRSQLAQLLLCEALVLSLVAGVVGLALAYWCVRAVPAVLTRTIPGLQEVAIDLRVLAFTVVVCLGSAVACALVPMITLDRRQSGDALRDEPSRITATRAKLHLQGGFVVLTVSLACVLLIGAGLFMRSLAALLATDVGFRPSRVLTASLTLPRTFYATGASVRTFHEGLLRGLEGLPGVRSAALATDLPLTQYEVRAFTPEGTDPQAASPTTNLSWVHGPYFETLGITLRSGRLFAADEHAQLRGVVIVNEKLAALAWPGQDPIGKRLKWGGTASRLPWLTVVGVVRNVADGPIGREPGVHAYEPFRQYPDFFLDGAPNQFGRDVRAAILAEGDPRALAGLVRQEIARLDPALAVERIETLNEQVLEVAAPRRLSTLLLGGFAGIALLLASIGLYGLMAFTIEQRRREIAVRMALGAERHAVIQMVIGRGARLVAAGLVLGLAGSLALTRVFASLLYQTKPYDLATFGAVPLVLTASALLACAIPAWRAVRVSPAAAIRE